MKILKHSTFAAILPIAMTVFAGIGITHAAPKDAAAPYSISSPDGKLVVGFHLDAEGAPRYRISRAGQAVLRESDLGLVRDDADFSKKLSLLGASKVEPVKDDYEILTAKRRSNHYAAQRQVFHLAAAGGEKMDVMFQVSNDGVAFRYGFPGSGPAVRRLSEERSSFHFLPETRAWMQPMSVAKSGWAKTNPSYEEYYQKDVAVGTPSSTGAGWAYPALFCSGDTWLLVSESGLSRGYCATRLRPEVTDGEYRVGFPDPRENYLGGPVNPESKLPWVTPWRLIAVGSLKTVTESMLGVDLATAAKHPATPAIEPGKAAWSWPLMGDGKTVYEVQKRFIDYAVEMKWRYCLIDAQWDTQIGYDKMKELADYAKGNGVKILVWYNSNGNWNDAYQTPKNRMATHEARIQEFDRLKAMGIAGMKIDFFGGDGQSMIGYYLDLLEDAEPYGFLINFHGCTLPRGLQRTYPHLMTVEAIRGQEFITFEQKNADEQPTHAAMLPFTRNVFDPMDFTPMVLDQMPNVKRRTSSAFELAAAVLFTSGIQHYAEIPDGMAKAPENVRVLLKKIPSVWDDSKFLDGFPGRYVAMARKGGGYWYLCGINAEKSERKFTLDLKELSAGKTGHLITDGAGENLSFRSETVTPVDGKLELTIRPNGGFVIVMD